MIYLNNAATTFPKPQETLDAVNACISEPPIHSARSGSGEEGVDPIMETRELLAKLFNAPNPNNIIFTSGSTEALNIAIKGSGLKGGHVVATLIEHNSVIRPLNALKEKGEIEVDFADCDETGFVHPESIEKLIKPETKAVILNFVSNVTGTIQDVKAISKIAHDHGCLFILDASQGAGTVPLDVHDMDIDLMAFTGHKNLYGIQGIGGLFVKEGIELEPLKTGGTGIRSMSLVQPKELPYHLESGTPNKPGIMSLNAGVKWVLEQGIDKIHARKQALMEKIIKELDAIPEIKSYKSDTRNSYSVYTFNVGKMAPEEVNYMLESSYDIFIRAGIHCAPLTLKPLGIDAWGTLRCSPSYFTTEQEVERFIEAIKDIIKTFIS